MNNIQETSLNAYREEVEPTLGQRQGQVLEILKDCDNATNSEIAEKLGWSINRVTGRVFELRKSDLVVQACKRTCKVTKRTVLAWELKK